MLQSRRRAFSLIELVIVVVILGIIGAIAIPRISRGAEGAKDSALVADLATLRNAIDLYHTEHEGLYPAAGTFEDQMTLYTDLQGNTSATKGGDFIYGPYLRSVPALPVGSNRGDSQVAQIDGAGVGWIYDPGTGDISANLPDGDVDASGKQYNEY